MSSASSLLSIATILLVLFPLILATPITLQQFPNKPGLYFEGIGTVNRVVGEWKIITFFNLSPIQTELQIFQNGTRLLEKLCPLLQQSNMCTELVKHLTNINFELQETKLIKIRRARGAFDVIGNIANKLFGVLDSDYAKDVSKVIKQLNNNDITLSEMIQNQTSIIDTTINILKKETQTIVIKFNELQAEANMISKEITNVEKQINLLETYTSLSTQLALLSSDLKRLEADIFDTLTGARHGQISPLLISPLQLQHEITKIKEHLPNTLRLPFNQNDVIHMYKFMNLQTGISPEHIMFIIRIPLTNNEAFNLFNIIPIPAVINDTMLIIQPETNLLAVTPHHDQYFALSKEELKECKAIKETANQLLCTNKQTNYHQGAQEYLCEISLLKNLTNTKCMWQETKSNSIWSPLQHTNQWIFGTKHATKISALCNGTAQLLELQGSSLLTLQNDCTLKHNTATIQAHQVYTTTMYTSHVAFGDLYKINKPILQPMFNGTPLDFNHELTQLKQLQKAINGDKLVKLPQLVEEHNIHHHITSYAALLLIVSTIIWLAWKLKSTRESNTPEDPTKPTPTARLSINPEVHL